MEENIQKYEFEKDKIIYKLKTSIIEGKYIKMVCNPKNQKYGYINIFSKEVLNKINTIFTNFSNIKEIQEAFDNCLLTRKVSLMHNRTLFNIFFYITRKEKEKEKPEKISLKLIYEPEFNSNNETKNKYNDILADIEKEIIIMAKEQENIENKVNEILLEYEYEKNKNEDSSNSNNNTKNKIYFNERKLKHFIKSSIIKKPEEYNLLRNKLLSKRKNNICKNINYKLLYQASKDSDKARVFHQKCDGKKNTMILIQTEKGIKLGGFTTQTWEGNAIKKDDDAFLFSLDNLKIYDIIKDQNAITCNENFGPIFCGYQIFIYDNFFKEGGKTSKAYLNYNTQEDFELNNGNMIFHIKELEVFEILFD